MSIAITEDHRALADTASDFLTKHDARGAARALLEAPEPRRCPTSGRTSPASAGSASTSPRSTAARATALEELVVVVEELGRAIAPGPFVPTVDRQRGARGRRRRRAAGEAAARPGRRLDHRRGRARTARSRSRDGAAHGSAGAVLGGGLADVLLVGVGDDVAVVELRRRRRHGRRRRRTSTPPAARPASTLDGAPATRHRRRARAALVDLARVLLSAEAVGIARECTESAAEYAKVREQFGRPIAHVPGGEAPLRQHARGHRAGDRRRVGRRPRRGRRAATSGRYTAAVAATLAGPAADLCANLNIQVHGGIGFTWEHDAHLYLRRATVLARAARARPGGRRPHRPRPRRRHAGRKTVDLPPEAEPIRDEVQAFADEHQGPRRRRAARPSSSRRGYVMPHWPKPWGRDAGAVEQLVIEQEFAAAGVKRPAYGITGWVILTLIQYATEDQVARWVRAGARPGRDLVPAVQRARRRLRRGRHQDEGHAGRRRLAGQRPEGVDQRRPRGRHGLRHRAHQPRRAEARRHHDDGDRHARRGRRGAAAADDRRRLGVQRGLLQRRVRARRRRGRPGRRRLDRRPGHARQREREHRRRPGRHGDAGRRHDRPVRRPPRAARRRRRPHRPLHRRPPGDRACSTCAAPTAPSPAAAPGPRAR